MPTFEPPTYQRTYSVRKPYFHLTESQSVVRINGTFTTVKTPSAEQLAAAGVEGEDFFLGGRTYQVSVSVADELTAAGYTVEG